MNYCYRKGQILFKLHNQAVDNAASWSSGRSLAFGNRGPVVEPCVRLDGFLPQENLGRMSSQPSDVFDFSAFR
ncbi:hypothetical protein ElyMa_006113000 [Elysia marginata]|uniref:Uncharacterized protein n=1 Tax=Elysia marginata TaxID=1093978 RepID=A0AAV4GV61_9GAST|nr:hypothetical protein ElyMa_006113000 [Elysia marginata]